MKKSKLDKEIEKEWSRQASGVQVNIMDIPKIFADVRRWNEEGLPIAAGVAGAINKYQQNKGQEIR